MSTVKRTHDYKNCSRWRWSGFMLKKILFLTVYVCAMIGSMTVGARWQSIAYPTKNVEVAIKGANGEKQILHGELFTNWQGEQILREGDGQEQNVSSFLYASYPAVKADTHDFPIRLFTPITLVMMAYGLFIVASWKKLRSTIKREHEKQ